MMNERFVGRWMVIAASLTMIAGSSIALAEDSKPADSDPAQVLKGPEIDDRDVPGATSTFGESDMKPAAGKERPIPHRAFMRSLRSLQGDDIAESLRATEEQVESIRAINRELREARRVYMQEHKDEFGDIGKERRRGGPEGTRAERGAPIEARDRNGRKGEAEGQGEREGKVKDRELSEEELAQREKMKELRANGPQAEAYHAQMWAVLSAEQQAFVREKIDTLLAEAREDGEKKKGGGQKKGKRQRKGAIDSQ